MRGNSILFSREYYAIVKAHLKPGGIASQWVPLYETSEAAIKIQMKTFIDAGPRSRSRCADLARRLASRWPTAFGTWFHVTTPA